MHAIVTRYKCILTFKLQGRGLSGALVTHLPPTTEVCGSKRGPIYGKVGRCFPMVGSLQNLVLVSPAHKTVVI